LDGFSSFLLLERYFPERGKINFTLIANNAKELENKDGIHKSIYDHKHQRDGCGRIWNGPKCDNKLDRLAGASGNRRCGSVDSDGTTIQGKPSSRSWIEGLRA